MYMSVPAEEDLRSERRSLGPGRKRWRPYQRLVELGG